MFIVFEQDLDHSSRVNRVWGMFNTYDDAALWLRAFTGKNMEQFYYGIRAVQAK